MKRQSNKFTKNAPHLSALSLAIAMALSAPALPAATITVNDSSDPGSGSTCTLREAVLSINAGSLSGGCANSGGAFGTSDTINFSGVTLVQLDGAGWGELDISSGHDLTINGSGVGGVTIQLTTGSVSVIAEPNPNLVANLTLTGLTITGGKGNAKGYGGGVYMPKDTGKTLTMSNSVVSGNSSSSGGGGIFADFLTMDHSTVSGNTSGYRGGGIYVWNYTSLSNSTVSGNQSAGLGGGLYTCAPTLTDSIVSNNNSNDNNGGGIGGIDGCGPATLTNTIVSGNHAGTKSNGGGIWFYGAVSLTNSTVSGNSAQVGGGIFSYSDNSENPATVTLINSTVSGNTGEYVSGVYTNYTAALYNSTISGNTTTVPANTLSTALLVGVSGGGSPESLGGTISNLRHTHHTSRHAQAARAQAVHRLASGKIQAGGGVYTYSTLVLSSSIVSNNSSLYDIVSPKSFTVTGGHNLLGNVFETIDTSGLTGDITGNPMLSPLANNGCATPAGAPGSTACVQTMALQTGSPAINAGSDPLDLNTDERGVAFARVFGSAADIGAFEVQPAATTTAPVPTPTLSRWALLALLTQLGFAAWYKLRYALQRNTGPGS